MQKQEEQARDGLPVPQRYGAMAAILLGISLTVIDSTLINLALPDITRGFDTSASSAVWVVNAYQLATLALLLPCAKLGERIGYRRVYLLGLVLFTLALFGCTFADSLPTLVAARAIQGLGAAGMMAVNSALVRLTYPAHALPRAIAINSVVVAASSVGGPTLAALVLSVASWKWLFIVQLPLCLLLLALAHRALPANLVWSREGLRPLDVVLNMAMFALIFLGADMLGARQGGPADGSAPLAAALLGAGLLVGWWYLRRQWHLPAPLFPVDLLRIPVFALSMCTSVTAFAAHTLAFVALPFMLLEGQGRGHLQAGLLITAWPVAIVLVAPFVGRLIGRVRSGLLGGIGLGILAMGLALVAALPAPGAWQLAGALFLCGVGFGIFQSPNNHTLVTSAPLRRAGAASGMLGTARLTGQSLGAVLLALVFSVFGVQGGGVQAALMLAAALAAVSACFSLLRLRA